MQKCIAAVLGNSPIFSIHKKCDWMPLLNKRVSNCLANDQFILVAFVFIPASVGHGFTMLRRERAHFLHTSSLPDLCLLPPIFFFFYCKRASVARPLPSSPLPRSLLLDFSLAHSHTHSHIHTHTRTHTRWGGFSETGGSFNVLVISPSPLVHWRSVFIFRYIKLDFFFLSLHCSFDSCNFVVVKEENLWDRYKKSAPFTQRHLGLTIERFWIFFCLLYGPLRQLDFYFIFFHSPFVSPESTSCSKLLLWSVKFWTHVPSLDGKSRTKAWLMEPPRGAEGFFPKKITKVLTCMAF